MPREGGGRNCCRGARRGGAPLPAVGRGGGERRGRHGATMPMGRIAKLDLCIVWLPAGGKVIRVAVVGAGYWGSNLVRVFNELGSLDRVCDFSPERLAGLADRYPNVRMVRSYDAILEDPAIDAVVIATPAEHHYAMARQALMAGKDVYV